MPPRIFRERAISAILIGLFCISAWTAAAPALADGPADAAAGDSWQKVAVGKTFDNVPFDYQIKFLSQRNGYRVYQIKCPSPVKTSLVQNNTVPAEYYLPNNIPPGSPRRPAVICLHILDGNDALTDLVCSMLALRGVPAIMFRLPYYGERGLPEGPLVLARDPKLFAGAIAQAGQDLRRTIDVLASRPEVDADRIGVTGISLGGIIAATAAGGEPRINRAAFVLAGGDLMKIIHHARETQPLSKMILELPPDQRKDIESKIADVDPLRFASALKDKARQGKVMMINAAEDEVIPRASTEKLAAAMEMSDRVQWIQGLGHYTSMAELPRVLKTIAKFFGQDLPPSVTPPVVEKQTTPFPILAGVLGQVATILDTKPEAGRCHIVDIEVTVLPKRQNSPLPTNLRSVPGEGQGEGVQKGRFRLVRGSEAKFIFYLKMPTGTEISIGQNDHPWMSTVAKEVYEGTENPGPALKDPLELFTAKQIALLRMLAGVLNSVALAPDVLERLIVAKDEGLISGSRVIQISAREKITGSVRFVIKPEGNPEEYTPQTLAFDFPGAEGSIKFVDWKINTPAQDALFQPPANLPSRQVEQSFLYMLFSTSLKFALGTVE
jgi:dienelactone hydrolase